MTDKEYKQKKLKCWKKFCKSNGLYNQVHVLVPAAFKYAFDRAYSLGKQTEAISQEDVEKAAEEYCDQHSEEIIERQQDDCKTWNPLEEGIMNAFIVGANYALGKQEKDADAVISGWVARDSNGNLYFYRCKPERVRYINSNDGLWMSETINELNSDLFPDLTWESDPEPVEITIKRKNNG